MIQVDEQFYSEIRELPSWEKLKIVEFLLSDLDKPDPEIDRVWAEEAERRLSAYKAGKVKSFGLEEVFGKNPKSTEVSILFSPNRKVQ